MTLTLVSDAVVREIATLELVFEAVRDALVSVATDEATILPVLLVEAEGPGAMFGIKTATHFEAGLLGFKVGSYFPQNHARGIPNHGSTTMLLDADTGLPAALVSASFLNGLRTAAANAVAVEHLARPGARTLGVIGAGHQAEFEVRAVASRRSLDEIRIWSRNRQRADGLCARLDDLGCKVESVATAQEAVCGSDLITTVTPSRSVLVRKEWVAPGAHISAMGSDTPGKQEIDPALMKRAAAFADLPRQSVRVGEFQHAVGAGFLDERAITALGDVILGKHPGRRSADEITVFDSSGVAPQDLHAAAAVLKRAIAQGRAETVDF